MTTTSPKSIALRLKRDFPDVLRRPWFPATSSDSPPAASPKEEEEGNRFLLDLEY